MSWFRFGNLWHRFTDKTSPFKQKTFELDNWEKWNGYEGEWIGIRFHCRALCPKCKQPRLTMHHFPEAPGSMVGQFINCGNCGFQKVVKREV